MKVLLFYVKEAGYVSSSELDLDEHLRVLPTPNFHWSASKERSSVAQHYRYNTISVFNIFPKCVKAPNKNK